MKDNVETKIEETEVSPKKPFVRRVFDAARTETGKTVLTVTGTVAALAATYVLGFRKGMSDTIEVLSDANDKMNEDSEEELVIEIEAPDTSEDSEEE